MKEHLDIMHLILISVNQLLKILQNTVDDKII